MYATAQQHGSYSLFKFIALWRKYIEDDLGSLFIMYWPDGKKFFLNLNSSVNLCILGTMHQFQLMMAQIQLSNTITLYNSTEVGFDVVEKAQNLVINLSLGMIVHCFPLTLRRFVWHWSINQA